jgi:superfamily II DNA or RNA helicase
MRPAILAGCMKIPLECIDVKRVKKQVTYTHRPLSLDDGEPDLQVAAWYVERDFLCVPRQYGLTLCNQLHLDYVDETSLGQVAHFPKVPDPREYQEPQLDEIGEAFQDYYDFIFKAHTGWGKTVGALISAARLGRTTIIVVDQENLRLQWVDALVNLFGFAKEDVGVIKGDKWTWKGKAVTVAMVQTLAQRGVDEELADYFGFAIFDEVHTCGAPTFSTALMYFNAAYRLGVSATPKRKDGLQRALDHNLGKIRVQANKKHKRSAVYLMRNETVYSWYGNVSKMTGRIFSEITEDGPRNLMIVEAALWLYESGRDVLILSDRIEHLKELESMLYYFGVAEEEMGLYTGYDPIWRFAKDPNPEGRPANLERWQRKDRAWEHAEYCAVSMQIVQKRIPKARFAHILKHSKIVLATYGMFAKGVDCPRLSGGVDATPRSSAEQVHGRILREVEGKPVPIWVTIMDINSYRLMFTLANRIKEYLKSSGVLFEWHPDGSIEQCDVTDLKAEIFERVDDLKSQRIETNKDGLNTLVTAADENRRKRTKDQDMVAKFKRPQRPRHRHNSDEERGAR